MDGKQPPTMTGLGFVPPTVESHSEQPDGVTLHTIDHDPDTDIEVYDDGREMHLSGNPPEDA